MDVKILSAAKALPEFTRPTADALPYLDTWLTDRPKRFVDKVKRIFKYSQVEHRYSIMPIEEVFTNTSFEEKNERFRKAAIELGKQALLNATQKAGIDLQEIDYLITTCCTGFMIPSVDAYLINELNLRQDVVRLPVTEMGCAAGVSALIYGYDLLKSNPGKKAAIVAIESPTSTFQHNDFSMANMVSAAIFGDGASCTILGSSDQVLPSIVDTSMYHFYNEERMMGFDLTNQGLKMVLDVEVPNKIEARLLEILQPFLEEHELTFENINHFVFHPGGKRIVQLVEELLQPLGKNIDDTKEILRAYGNMSSATILFVLERFMDKKILPGEKGLMLSFGPGFSAQQILLEWK
ncbi:MAG: type III polyketide synthase [Crocinitomicaceae bacterium]|nr:type III polyketide synthase [Crocinitomicaceae bacterium]|tara:strand:- start:1834 stop:2886 length:1053 start_codon:yes stop_codon:yes gene_type:complete